MVNLLKISWESKYVSYVFTSVAMIEKQKQVYRVQMKAGLVYSYTHLYTLRYMLQVKC